MAKCTVNLPDDLAGKLSKLAENAEESTEKVLLKAGKDAVGHVKSALQKALSGESSGELLGSLGVSSVKVDRFGNYDVKIGFREPRSDGDSNAKIANILEYGSPTQPPRPFLAKAKRAVSQKMQNASVELEHEILEALS